MTSENRSDGSEEDGSSGQFSGSGEEGEQGGGSSEEGDDEGGSSQDEGEGAYASGSGELSDEEGPAYFPGRKQPKKTRERAEPDVTASQVVRLVTFADTQPSQSCYCQER